MKEFLRFSLAAIILYFSSSIACYGIDYKLYYFVDSLSTKSIENSEKLDWKGNEPYELLTLGYNENATIWCKLVVATSSIKNNNLLWSFNNIHLDSITIYQNKEKIHLSGDRTDTKNPLIRSYAFRIPAQKVDSTVLIAAVKKQLSFIDFSSSLEKEETLIEKSNTSFSLAFIFLGFALMLLLFNLYILFQIKDTKYLYYIIYSSIGIIYVIVNIGLAKYLLPTFLFFSEFRIFSGCYWYLFLGLFLTEILEFKKNCPKINFLLLSFQWVVAVLSIFSLACLFFHKENWIIYPSFFIYLLFFVNIILLTLGISKAIKNKNHWSWFVVISFIPHILWGLQMILTAFEIITIPININWISIIILYEMFLFGWKLIQDYVDAFKQRQILQNQLISEEKRTIESIEQARIKERRLIADLLHDKIGIDIAHSIHLLALENKNEAIESLVKLSSDIRNLSHTILPKALENGALISAIESQLKITRLQNKSVEVLFNEYDFPPSISADLAFSLYLITMEIIQNAIKHGQPTTINIDFFQYTNEKILSFQDDGCGFIPNNKEGFGLNNIQRRIRDFGGQTTIDSVPQKGTTIIIQLPN